MEAGITPEAILAAELEYVTRAAFQANEDRAKVTTLYLLTVASFLAAIFSLQFDVLTSRTILMVMAGLFVILSGYASLTMLQLVKLRQAWHESVTAMNQIKDYYLAHLSEVSLVEAFALTGKTIPNKFKTWSISFLLAIQVTLLGAASLAAAVLFLGLALDGTIKLWVWIVAILVALIYFFDLLAVYWWLLREEKEEG
jgi:hypothetical protein